MARREVTQFFDDLTNAPLSEGEVNVIDFSIKGRDYTIDLSAENAEKFEELLQPYVEAGRRSTRRTAARKSAARTSNPKRNTLIREWAAEQGIEVSQRGRLPQDVIDRYNAAH